MALNVEELTLEQLIDLAAVGIGGQEPTDESRADFHRLIAALEEAGVGDAAVQLVMGLMDEWEYLGGQYSGTMYGSYWPRAEWERMCERFPTTEEHRLRALEIAREMDFSGGTAL